MAESLQLKVVGADEDIPRLILAYGRVEGAEVALVLRPREGQSLLIHQEKKSPAKVWISDLDRLPAHIELPQRGPLAGDAPQKPAWELPVAEAVKLINRLKASPPGKGPASLKGTWAGKLHYAGQIPQIHLQRKVASYGVLKVQSDADGHWHALFERDAKWFSAAKQEKSPAVARLAEAIQRGMVQMTGLVSEACSFRDTRRRNAVDTDYAAQFPYREPKAPTDPTNRYQPRSSFRVVESSTGFDVVNEAGIPVAKFGSREKGKASSHVAALNQGKGTPAVPSDAPTTQTTSELAQHFGLSGMPGLHTEAPPPLSAIPAPEPPSCPTSVQKIADATQKEADAIESLSASVWGTTEGPALLSRAGKLIRHAEALIKSPLCIGKEKQAAWEDLKRAADAYNQAREALNRGDTPDIVTTLRRVAERVSLAAARAAKSCAAPKSQGTSLPDSTAESTRMAPTVSQPAPVSKPSRSRKPKAEPPPAPSLEVDPAKDALLVGAFADAIKSVAAQMGQQPAQGAA